MAKSSRKKLARRVRQAILAQAILPEQIRRGDYELINPAEIDSSMPQTLVPRNKRQWAIEGYYSRGLITETQRDAGFIFFLLCWRAKLTPRVTSPMEPKIGTSQANYWHHIPDDVADAKKEVARVLERIGGGVIASMALDAIVFEKSPQEIGGYGAHGSRLGMAYIKLVLNQLAIYYRLLPTEK